MQSLKVSLVQYDISWENSPANLNRLERILNEIHGSDLVVLPEMFNTGFSMNPRAIAQSEADQAVEWLKKKSVSLDATLITSVAIKEGDKFYNRLLVVSEGRIAARYDKRNCFSLAGEDKHYSAGTQNITFEIKGWKIKPLVCYDLRFPLWCYNREEADVMIFVANWPESRVMHWDTLLKARAIENQAFIIGVNRIGMDGNNNRYNGHSTIISPFGNYLLGPLTESGVFGAFLEKVEIERYRSMLPLLEEERSKSSKKM